MLLQKLRRRIASEKGFTLIELLVVVLIIGILAAIALPSFLGQKAKGQDASAKSDARNAVSQIESCYSATEDYALCGLNATAADYTGLSLLTSVTGSSTGYVIVATSASANTFTITKSATGIARTCSNVGTAKGACKGPAGTAW